MVICSLCIRQHDTTGLQENINININTNKPRSSATSSAQVAASAKISGINKTKIGANSHSSRRQEVEVVVKHWVVDNNKLL